MVNAPSHDEPVSHDDAVTAIVIGPWLARTSDAIENAFREAAIPARCIWYYERDFERGWITTQLARVAMLAASRLGTSAMAEQLRLGAHRVRFDQHRASRHISILVAEQVTSGYRSPSDGLAGPVVVLIKPAMMSTAALQELLAKLRPDRVIAYLWDPLWRTPAVRAALTLAGKVYSTEARDAGRDVTLLALPPSPVLNRPVEGVHGGVADVCPTVFFCGTFTPRRLIRALVVVVAAKRARVRADITLVAKSRLLRQLMRVAGIGTDAKDPSEYERSARKSRVLLDLGQKGQDSPSDRLNDARVFVRPLISQNPTVRGLEVVIPVERWIPSELASALRRATEAEAGAAQVNASTTPDNPKPAQGSSMMSEARDWALTIMSV
jgi:hypothetical protein